MSGMAKFLTILFVFLGFFRAQAQEDDSVFYAFFRKDVEIVDPNYKRNYAMMVMRIKRVYGYALHARDLLEEYEKDLSPEAQKRQLKKYGKTAHKKLVDDFEYAIKNMYVNDGKVLMKLVHRETGHTVYDIIAKYRGPLKAGWYASMGKLFEQDLKAVYNGDKEDWLMERIIQEVKAGKHQIDPPALLTKDEFKEIRKKDKETKRENAAKLKERKKEKKRLEKEKKREGK
jgi:hypothetical protein